MNRRSFSILLALMLLLAAITVSVCATEENAAVNAQQCYDTLQAAVEDYTAGVIQLCSDAADITVTKDVYLDLNGHSISDVTVTGGTLYCMDSQTADYSVADGNYGKLTDVTGSVAAISRETADADYLMVTADEGISFHAVELQITAMTLRPGAAGVYYASRFSGDEVVARQVQSYGIALSVKAVPTALNMDALCAYSVCDDFAFGTNSATGTLLTGIMSESNTAEENTRNAAMPVYGRPYIQTAEGYVFGSYIARDLQTQVEAVDGILQELNASQADALLAMYQSYRSVMDLWEIPNIKALYDEIVPTEKIVTKFRGDFLYRIGNRNAVSVGSLFAAAEGVTVEDVALTVTTQSGSASGTYTAADTWTDGKLSFSGLGVVNVTVTAAGAIPVRLQLEVVEAVNTTAAMSATANNVVLLNDTGFGSVDVKNGYTLYGNGFKMTCGSDTPALDMGYAFLTMENGNLDNVQVICPNFWHASLYKANLTSEDNEVQVDGTKYRYYNARSAVMASGNNTIANSYISGGRAAIYLTSGMTVLDNTTVYGGAAANIHVLPSASGLVLRDVKLIQEPIRATAKDKTIMGMSVVLMSADGLATVPPVTLEGELIQYAWIDAEDAQYIPEDTSAIVDEVFAQTDFIHSINGQDSVNLGFVVTPADDRSTGTLVVNDNRTNKDTVPFAQTVLDIAFVGDVGIFSYTNQNGTDPAFLTKPEHTPAYNAAPLSMDYLEANEARTLTKEYNTVTGAWEYKLVVNLDASEYELDFAALQVLRQGVAIAYTVTDAEGNPVDQASKIPLTIGNVKYTLTTDDGIKIPFTTVSTREEILAPELVAANYESGLCIATSYGSTWSGAAPALEGIQVRYYSVAEGGYKTIDLVDCTPTTPGQQNGTDNTWYYEAEESDFTLMLTGGQVHSSNNIFAMPVVCEGKLYFVASSSKGLVNSGNTARMVKVTYVFRDNATGESLTFSHTWSVEENKDEQYKYTDFCGGTLTKLEGTNSGGGCVTPDTLVTLADGSKKEIQHITEEDRLLVWNFYTGRYDNVPAILLFNMGTDHYDVLHLCFEDGSVVKVINGHRFFDAGMNRFELVSKENVESFLGHEFIKTAGESYTAVRLQSYTVTREYTTSYSIMSACHYNFFVEDFLSDTFHREDAPLFEYFEIGDQMKYDELLLRQDIEKYGLYTYEEFSDYLTYEQFEALCVKYMKVSVGKGKATVEDILALITTYVK